MRSAIFLLTLAACAFPALSAKPDFSGSWTINLNRSEYASQPQPKSIVQTILHKEPSLSIDFLEKSPLDQDAKYTLKYTTDGKETTNTVLGNAVKATATWERDELVVHSWADFGGRRLDIKDRWRLAEGGATIIMTRHYEGAAGVIDQVLVFDKK